MSVATLLSKIVTITSAFTYVNSSMCRNPRAGERSSVGAIISFIKRLRKAFFPPVPQTLEELGNVLENYGPTREIYRGVVTPRDGSSALIFAHTDMLEFLSHARWLHIDGTFKVSLYFLYMQSKFIGGLLGLHFRNQYPQFAIPTYSMT